MANIAPERGQLLVRTKNVLVALPGVDITDAFAKDYNAAAAKRAPPGYREAADPAGPPRFAPDGKLSLHRRLCLLFQSGDSCRTVRI